MINPLTKFYKPQKNEYYKCLWITRRDRKKAIQAVSNAAKNALSWIKLRRNNKSWSLLPTRSGWSPQLPTPYLECPACEVGGGRNTRWHMDVGRLICSTITVFFTLYTSFREAIVESLSVLLNLVLRIEYRFIRCWGKAWVWLIIILHTQLSFKVDRSTMRIFYINISDIDQNYTKYIVWLFLRNISWTKIT